jgi:hypothetical protein
MFMDTLQRFETLPLLEQSVLWSMRCWAIGCRAGTDSMPRIVTLFDRLRAPEASRYLDGLMWALNGGATRMLDVNCVCHHDVSLDEALLLDGVALHQEGRRADAQLLFETLMTPMAAEIACASAARLVTALNAAGHHFPRAADALRRYGLTASLRRGSIAASMSVH